MPVSLSLADVIDKNKIASENAWLIFVKADIRDDYGTVIETMHLVQNNENVVYQGETWIAAALDIEFSKRTNEEPSMTFTAQDVTGAIREKMEDYNGGVGFEVTMIVANSANLDAEPELEEVFEVTGASAPDIAVEWTLGAENPLKYPFPYRRQHQDRCPWLYKGRRCKYSGPMQSCSYTKDGDNGCKAHNNLARFGGFPGLQNRS